MINFSFSLPIFSYRQWNHQLTQTPRVKLVYFPLLDDENDVIDEDGGYSYKDMLRRDERRWKRAAKSEDLGGLTREQFQDFLHPEDVEHMRDIVIDVSNYSQFYSRYSCFDIYTLFYNYHNQAFIVSYTPYFANLTHRPTIV